MGPVPADDAAVDGLVAEDVRRESCQSHNSPLSPAQGQGALGLAVVVVVVVVGFLLGGVGRVVVRGGVERRRTLGGLMGPRGGRVGRRRGEGGGRRVGIGIGIGRRREGSKTSLQLHAGVMDVGFGAVVGAWTFRTPFHAWLPRECDHGEFPLPPGAHCGGSGGVPAHTPVHSHFAASHISALPGVRVRPVTRLLHLPGAAIEASWAPRDERRALDRSSLLV